jgi:hypothetical protein
MKAIKKEILEKHGYTELVYERINKKLGIHFSKKEIASFMKQIISETEVTCFKKIGKNFYITNKQQGIKITVNSTTFRIITVNQLIS